VRKSVLGLTYIEAYRCRRIVSILRVTHADNFATISYKSTYCCRIKFG